MSSIESCIPQSEHFLESRPTIDYKGPSFGEACQIFRDAKTLGHRVPEQVMSVIAFYAAERDLEVPLVVEEILHEGTIN